MYAENNEEEDKLDLAPEYIEKKQKKRRRVRFDDPPKIKRKSSRIAKREKDGLVKSWNK